MNSKSARVSTLVFALSAAACLAAPLMANAQAYPVKPIRMVVPYPPGGIDPYARVMMPAMIDMLVQQIGRAHV